MDSRRVGICALSVDRTGSCRTNEKPLTALVCGTDLASRCSNMYVSVLKTPFLLFCCKWRNKREVYFFMKKFSTKRIVFLGLMAAISIVLTRLLSITIDPQTLRISLGNVPVILVSLWFGPIEGAVVGFIADIIGATVFSPYGWNPLLAPTSVIMGLLPGLFSKAFSNRFNFLTVFLVTLLTNCVGTIAYSTFALSEMSNLPYLSVLAIRLPVYLVIAALEALCIYYLTKSGINKYLDK